MAENITFSVGDTAIIAHNETWSKVEKIYSQLSYNAVSASHVI